jgi:hypothetical protein
MKGSSSMADSRRKIEIKSNTDSKRRKHLSTIYTSSSEVVDRTSDMESEIFDFKVGKKNYRAFVSKKQKQVICREVVSYNYKGMILFRNPVDQKISKQIQDLIQNLPRGNRLDTLAHSKQKTEKFNKQEKLSLQSKKQLVGNQPSTTLLKATLWCIKSHPKHLKYKRPTLLRAYKKFGGKTHTEESFVKMIGKKWNEFIREYNRQPVEFRRENSKEIYAKSKLKIPRNSSKQKVKENKKTFN